MSTGQVVQVIGAVVDAEFPRDQLPKVYDALKAEEFDLTLEVQQQLGDGVVPWAHQKVYVAVLKWPIPALLFRYQWARAHSVE